MGQATGTREISEIVRSELGRMLGWGGLSPGLTLLPSDFTL